MKHLHFALLQGRIGKTAGGKKAEESEKFDFRSSLLKVSRVCYLTRFLQKLGAGQQGKVKTLFGHVWPSFKAI